MTLALGLKTAHLKRSDVVVSRTTKQPPINSLLILNMFYKLHRFIDSHWFPKHLFYCSFLCRSPGQNLFEKGMSEIHFYHKYFKPLCDVVGVRSNVALNFPSVLLYLMVSVTSIYGQGRIP